MRDDELDVPRAAERLHAEMDAALLQLDRETIETLATLSERVSPVDGDDQLWLDAARLTLALATGHAPEPAVLRALETRAREARCGEVVLRTATLRAFAAECNGDLDGAVEQARRAFRMARTERYPQAEYWAGWTLARQRRLTGRPYLAARILAAQLNFAPQPWVDWIALQLILSGGAPPLASTPSSSHLLDVLERASTADPGIVEAAQHVEVLASAFEPLRADVRSVNACLGLAQPQAGSTTAQWLQGAPPFAPPPHGLSALSDDPLAVVVAHPDGSRRLLGRARLRLASDHRDITGSRPGRTESLLAALALRGGDGFDEDALFSAVYGFNYNPAIHRGAWDVALHRARMACTDVATLRRGDGRVTLDIASPFVVADPRCLRGHEDRVLQSMAANSGTSAKEIADGLGLSLRTVQDVLRDLVDTGACQLHREGRRRLYTVEDTTFREPTRSKRSERD